MKRGNMTESPEAPTGVELVRADGSTMGLELFYLGTNENGVHIWEATAKLNLGDKVRVEKLPGNTGITFKHSVGE
jgi:hypothetical protein